MMRRTLSFPRRSSTLFSRPLSWTRLIRVWDADRDAIFVAGYRLRRHVSEIDVQVEAFTIHQADTCALRTQLRPPIFAGARLAPAPGSGIVRNAAVALCDVRLPIGNRKAQQSEETINRI